MQVIRDLKDFPKLDNAVVTSGTFDGVHIGHQKIIDRLVHRARETNGQSVAITYWPHPRLILSDQTVSLQLLSSIEERISQLSRFAIDYLLIIPFTKDFANLDAEQYVRLILQDTVQAKKLIIGYDHHFGKNREGSFAYLQEHGPAFGFTVEEIPAVDIQHVAVSSTKIRKALETGDILTATSFLGRPYSLTGTVVKGQQLGRTIGYPTANLAVADSHKLIPAQGIYAVNVEINDTFYGGMLSIGTNPTVGGTTQTIEVNIFNFDQDIYNQLITLHFLQYLRPEEKYTSLDELTRQLEKDKAASLDILRKTNI